MAYTLILGSIDLTEYTRVAYGEGMDPANSEFSTPQFSESPFSDGQALVSRSYGNKGQGYPLLLNAATKDALHDLITLIEAECKKKIRLEFRDDGASASTFFDVEAAKLEHDFNFRRSTARHAQAVLRVWTRPFGHGGAYTTIATAQGSGPFLTAALPVVDGDEPAQLEGYVRVGSRQGTYGQITGIGVAQPSRLLRIPAASFALYAGATRMVTTPSINSVVYQRDPFALGSTAFRVNLSPASLYEGRQRVLALGRLRHANPMLIGVLPDGPPTLGTTRDWAIHDLGVVDIQPGRRATYSLDIGVVPEGLLDYSTAQAGRDQLGDAGRAWGGNAQVPATFYEQFEWAEIYVVPEDNTALTMERTHKMIAADGMYKTGLLTGQTDYLGDLWALSDTDDPSGNNFNIGWWGEGSKKFRSPSSAVASYTLFGNIARHEKSLELRVRATVKRPRAAANMPSAMVGVTKFMRPVTSVRMDGILTLATGNTGMTAAIRYGFLNGATVLVSAAVPSALCATSFGDRYVLELRSEGERGTFNVWVGPTLAASMGVAGSLFNHPGQGGIIGQATAGPANQASHWVVEGFDVMAGLRAAPSARTYHRYHAEDGVTGGPTLTEDNRRVDKHVRGRVPVAPVGSTPAVAFAFALTDESAYPFDILDVDVRVRERFTYMR